jgi:uncharacterized membrane protein
MSRNDNVTPFRPRRPPPRQPSGKSLQTPRGKAVLVQALPIVAFAATFLLPTRPLSYIALGISIAAFLIALANRAEPMPWARTHHEHALRTIIIGYAIWTLSSAVLLLAPQLAPLVFIIHIVVLIWVAVRSGVGLVLAIMRRPIWRPTGILF